MNLHYDIYRDTNEVLKAVRSENQERLAHHLPYQGSIPSFLFLNSLQLLNRTLYDVQGKMPTNIFKFTIKYLSNSLPTGKINANGILAKLLTTLFAFFRKLLFMS